MHAASTLLVLCFSTPVVGAPGPEAARSAPRKPPKISGFNDKPTPNDSRYPTEQARPAGALLGPLPAPLVLQREKIILRCRYQGVGCGVRHQYVIRNPGPAKRAQLTLVAGSFAVTVRARGKVIDHEARETGDASPTAKRWRSTGLALDPAQGAGNPKTYRLGGRSRSRRVHRYAAVVDFAAQETVTVELRTRSVGGFDRGLRRRTMPEVVFIGTRRKDFFTYHHELPLGDPEARRRPGGKSGRVEVEIEAPEHLVVGSNASLSCRGAPRKRRRCTGQLTGSSRYLRLALASKYKRWIGFFAGFGFAGTHRGIEGLLRLGVSAAVRKRRDLVTLTVETDAKERVALGATYQLYTPYKPHTHSMGFHGEAGLVLDVHPAVRPAIRLGAGHHVYFIRTNLLFDFYPGELKAGGGVSWRLLFVVGLGI